MEPITRKEMFLAKAAGQDVSLPDPITREEMYLKKIAERAGSGGGSGGSSAPSDWNAAEGEAGYILNRTHYEEVAVVSEPLNLTWDGNTDGLVSIMDSYYKVFDRIFTNEEIRLMTVTMSDGTTLELASVWDMLFISDDAFAFDAFMVVRKDGFEFNGIVFPESGVYLLCSESGYVSSLTTVEPIESVKTVVHKLPEKFLPTLPLIVSVKSMDESTGAIIMNHTSDEVRAALAAGSIALMQADGVLLVPTGVAGEDSEGNLFAQFAVVLDPTVMFTLDSNGVLTPVEAE